MATKPRPTKPPLALDVEGETADGDTFHWYSDSRRAGNRPQNMSFAKQRGEGWGPGSVALTRKVMRDYADLNLLDNIRFVGKDGHIAHESRVHDFARTNDPVQQFSINLIGWFATAAFRRFTEIYVDRSLGGWHDAGALRKQQSLEAGRSPQSMATANAAETGLPELRLQINGKWVTPQEVEAWYDAGAARVAKVYYEWIVSDTNANFELKCYVSDDEITTGAISSGDLAGGLAANAGWFEPSSAKRFVTWKWFYPTGGGTEGAQFVARIRRLALFGDHGLPLYGATAEQGPVVSDMMADIFSRFTRLTFAGEATTYPVQQATFVNAKPVDAVKSLNDLHLFEIGARANRQVYFQPADLTKYDWQVNTDDPGVRFAPLQGDSIESFANGVEVTFTDFWGNTVTLYPSDFAELRDESESNPANRHGDELWAEFTCPYPTSLEDALQMGRAYLAEYNRPKAPGTITIAGGYIRDAAGHWQQCSKVNESETIALVNHPNDAPRLITALSWQPLQLQLSVDNGYQLLEAYLNRLAKRREAANLT